MNGCIVPHSSTRTLPSEHTAELSLGHFGRGYILRICATRSIGLPFLGRTVSRHTVIDSKLLAIADVDQITIDQQDVTYFEDVTKIEHPGAAISRNHRCYAVRDN